MRIIAIILCLWFCQLAVAGNRTFYGGSIDPFSYVPWSPTHVDPDIKRSLQMRKFSEAFTESKKLWPTLKGEEQYQTLLTAIIAGIQIRKLDELLLQLDPYITKTFGRIGRDRSLAKYDNRLWLYYAYALQVKRERTDSFDPKVRRQRNEFEAKLRWLQIAINQSTQYTYASQLHNVMKSVAHFCNGDYGLARRVLQKQIDRDPKNAKLQMLQIRYLSSGNTEKPENFSNPDLADFILRRLMNSFPNEPRTWYLYGLLNSFRNPTLSKKYLQKYLNASVGIPYEAESARRLLIYIDDPSKIGKLGKIGDGG